MAISGGVRDARVQSTHEGSLERGVGAVARTRCRGDRWRLLHARRRPRAGERAQPPLPLRYRRRRPVPPLRRRRRDLGTGNRGGDRRAARRRHVAAVPARGPRGPGHRPVRHRARGGGAPHRRAAGRDAAVAAPLRGIGRRRGHRPGRRAGRARRQRRGRRAVRRRPSASRGMARPQRGDARRPDLSAAHVARGTRCRRHPGAVPDLPGRAGRHLPQQGGRVHVPRLGGAARTLGGRWPSPPLAAVRARDR